MAHNLQFNGDLSQHNMQSYNPLPTSLSSDLVYPSITYLACVLADLDHDGAHIDRDGIIYHPHHSWRRFPVRGVRWVVVYLLTSYGLIEWSPAGDVAVLTSRVR